MVVNITRYVNSNTRNIISIAVNITNLVDCPVNLVFEVTKLGRPDTYILFENVRTHNGAVTINTLNSTNVNKHM